MKPLRALPVLLTILLPLACNVARSGEEPALIESQGEEALVEGSQLQSTALGTKQGNSAASPGAEKETGEPALAKLQSTRLLKLSPAIKAKGLSLNQLTESIVDKKHQVEVYAVFEQAYAEELSLRALNEAGEELGRSEKQAALKQAADSSSYLTFHFDLRLPLAQVKSYQLHQLGHSKEAPFPSSSKKQTRPTRSAPSGLVGKDPGD